MLQVMKAGNMSDWESLLGVSVCRHTSLQKKKTVVLENYLLLHLHDLANSKNVVLVKHFVGG